MDHQEATQLTAVEKYLLNEMSPELRDEFEEHFFDCQECAADVRATAAFLDAARVELRKPEFASRTQLRTENHAPARSRFWMWKPAAAFALAASLLVIVYQNAVVYPRLRSEVAQLETPEILPTVSLVSGNSRGGGMALGHRIGSQSRHNLVRDRTVRGDGRQWHSRPVPAVGEPGPHGDRAIRSRRNDRPVIGC